MPEEYELSREEFELLYRRSIIERYGKSYVFAFLLLCILLFVLGFLMNGWLLALGLAIAGTAGAAFLSFALMRALVGVYFNSLKKRSTWGKTRVSLEPDVLIASTDLMKTELRWEAVTRIAEDARGFYLYLSPTQILLVPRRVFTSAQQAQEFWLLAQQYFQHARPATVAAERARLQI